MANEIKEIQVIYQGLHGLETTESMKEYVLKKVEELSKHSQKISDVTFSFSCRDTDKPSERMKVRVRLNLMGRYFSNFNAKAKAADMYAAIDTVVAILERKLRRRKRILSVFRKKKEI